MTPIARVALAVAFVVVVSVGILAIVTGELLIAGVFCASLLLLWHADPW